MFDFVGASTSNPCNEGIVMEETMMNATIEIAFMMPTIIPDELFIEE